MVILLDCVLITTIGLRAPGLLFGRSVSQSRTLRERHGRLVALAY